MSRKLLATAVAALAIGGGAAAPALADPGADLPTADQLTGVLVGLADPGVPFAAKGYLIEGGIGRLEARAADGLMAKAVAKGQIPLSFAVSNIAPAGPGAASANVTATGAAAPPVIKNITFVDQGGWKISRQSATAVLAIFSA